MFTNEEILIQFPIYLLQKYRLVCNGSREKQQDIIILWQTAHVTFQGESKRKSNASLNGKQLRNDWK